MHRLLLQVRPTYSATLIWRRWTFLLYTMHQTNQVYVVFKMCCRNLKTFLKKIIWKISPEVNFKMDNYVNYFCSGEQRHLKVKAWHIYCTMKSLFLCLEIRLPEILIINEALLQEKEMMMMKMRVCRDEDGACCTARLIAGDLTGGIKISVISFQLGGELKSTIWRNCLHA